VWAAALAHGAVPSTSLDIHFLLRMLLLPCYTSEFGALRSSCASHCSVATGLSDADVSVSLVAPWHAVALAACVLSASAPIVMLVPQCARIPHQPSERLLMALQHRAAGASLPSIAKCSADLRIRMDSFSASMPNPNSNRALPRPHRCTAPPNTCQ
jgi:hypothetical protein